MSGQWEIVRSKKDKANVVTKKMSKADKKKFIENAPKVEDLLPLSQVKTLYSTLDKSSSVKPQVKPKVKEEEKKKVALKKTHQQPQQEKKKEKPKSFDIAIKQILLEDLQTVLEVAKARNNNVPLPTVIDIVENLNDVFQIELSDPVFSSRPVNYPLSAVPNPIRYCFVEILSWAGKNSFQTVYERLLRDIVYDASRGQSSLGSRIFLQLISELKPRTAVHAMSETLKLRDSYQSNLKCWQSLLWAMGQAGFKDLSVGLSVWEKSMLPLIETRNYQRFVIDYMGRLVTHHSSSSTQQSVSYNEYLNALDAIFAPHGTTPAKLVDELNQHGRTLKAIALKSFGRNQMNPFFEPVMERLKSSRSDIYKKELQSFLWDVLKADHTTLYVWKKLYVNKKHSGKYLPQSASLLRLVEKDLRSSNPVLNVKEVKNVLRSLNDFNRKLQTTKPKTEGLRECTAICANFCTTEKMANKKKFPWKSLVFVLVIGGAGAFYVNETQKYGAFKNSPVGKYLEEIGVNHYAALGWEQTLVYTHKGVEWSKQNVPIYYAEASRVLAPYTKLLTEIFHVVKYSLIRSSQHLYAFAIESKPKVDQWMDDNIPGLIEKTAQYYKSVKEVTIYYGSPVYDFSKEKVIFAADWARTNIFVGKLSPENLQRLTLEAVNTTQEYVKCGYKWFVEQVNSGSS